MTNLITKSEWDKIKNKVSMCGLLVIEDNETVERKMYIPDDSNINNWIYHNATDLQEQVIFTMMTVKRFNPSANIKMQIIAVYDSDYDRELPEAGTGWDVYAILSEYTYFDDMIIAHRAEMLADMIPTWCLWECASVTADSSCSYCYACGTEEIIKEIQNETEENGCAECVECSSKYTAESGKTYDAYHHNNFVTFCEQEGDSME